MKTVQTTVEDLAAVIAADLRPQGKNNGAEIEGTVITSSYGTKTGQHTFIIQSEDGNQIKVMGRNLYPNIISHEQGEKSKAASRYS